MKKNFENYYSKSKKAKVLTTMSILNNVLRDGEESKFRVRIEDTVFVTVLGDSCADFSAIDLKTYSRITTAAPGLPVKKCPELIGLEGAFKNKHRAAISTLQSVVLTITIYLPGSIILF